MTGNIPFSYKGKTGKNTVTEDVEYNVYKLPDSDFSESTARVFDRIDKGKSGVLPLPNFVDLIETRGEVFS